MHILLLKIVEWIKELYNGKGTVIFEHMPLEVLVESEFFEIISSFHTIDAFCVELNDDYLCGIRANHFCVEKGYCECCSGSYGELEWGTEFVLVTANHKGTRMMTLIRMPYSKEDHEAY